jgi:hypothetical protein
MSFALLAFACLFSVASALLSLPPVIKSMNATIHFATFGYNYTGVTATFYYYRDGEVEYTLYQFVQNTSLEIIAQRFEPKEERARASCAIQTHGTGGYWGPGHTNPIIDACSTHYSYCGKVQPIEPRLYCNKEWEHVNDMWSRECLLRTATLVGHELHFHNTSFRFQAQLNKDYELQTYWQTPAFSPLTQYAFGYYKGIPATSLIFYVDETSHTQPHDPSQFQVGSCGPKK